MPPITNPTSINSDSVSTIRRLPLLIDGTGISGMFMVVGLAVLWRVILSP
jgi:hypothetical protein